MKYDDETYARLMRNVSKYKYSECYSQIKAFNEAMYLEHPNWFTPDRVVEGPSTLIVSNNQKIVVTAKTIDIAYAINYFFNFDKIMTMIVSHWESVESQGLKVFHYVPFVMSEYVNGEYTLRTRYMTYEDKSARYLSSEEEREMTLQDWLLNGYPQKS